ncbi:MAG: hypothetical protein AAFO69_13650 [Bacteroidota bacterium]
MKYLATILLSIICMSTNAQEINVNAELAKQGYFEAFENLKSMLEGTQPMSFKKAVFTVENAYMGGQLNYDAFEQHISFLKSLAQQVISQRPLIYDLQDKEKVEIFGSLFLLMTDTIKFNLPTGDLGIHHPFTYDFEDFFGEKDWSKMFVTKLLLTGKGNCHSLPFLYKILAEEMGETAYLALAPNHTYIKVKTEKTGWFNTELTSATFPIDAWIMASGYVHLSAVQNGIYMDTLSLKQSIAMNMTDLAKGYEKRFGKTENPEFLLECLNVALEHYPHYINAMLSKAETMKTIFEGMLKEYNVENLNDLLQIPKPRNWFLQMEQLYKQIHQLGYRRMPKKMYENWLTDLNQHKEKYLNKGISNNLNSGSK